MKLKETTLIFVFLAMLIATGCATPHITVPISYNNGSSAIAIRVHIENMSFGIHSPFGGASAGIERVRPDYIFFTKLDSINDSFEKDNILVSNYNYESIGVGFQMDTVDSFCLNVEPGVYIAVGAVGSGQSSHDNFLIYFSKDTIEATKTVVKPNTMAFMGEHTLDRLAISLWRPPKPKKLPLQGSLSAEDYNDPQQFYYYNRSFKMLILDGEETVFSRFPNIRHAFPSLHESKRSKVAEIGFLKKHCKTFKEHVWLIKLKNRLSMLKE